MPVPEMLSKPLIGTSPQLYFFWTGIICKVLYKREQTSAGYFKQSVVRGQRFLQQELSKHSCCNSHSPFCFSNVTIENYCVRWMKKNHNWGVFFLKQKASALLCMFTFPFQAYEYHTTCFYWHLGSIYFDCPCPCYKMHSRFENVGKYVCF